METDELTRILERSKPAVAPRTASMLDTLGDVCDSMTTPRWRRPSTNRKRLVVGSVIAASMIGAGAAAAVTGDGLWPGDVEVKPYTGSDGAACEMVLTASGGTEESRTVAEDLLRTFKVAGHSVAGQDVDHESRIVERADDMVNDELERRGLPAVNVQAESVCEPFLR